MVEADAERGGVVRVLRISHSATVAAWRGRERALRDLGVDVTLLAAREWNAGGAPVALAHGEEASTVPVRTWGRHPALFVYDPIPLWRALGERWDVVDIHEEPFALGADPFAGEATRVRSPGEVDQLQRYAVVRGPCDVHEDRLVRVLAEEDHRVVVCVQPANAAVR